MEKADGLPIEKKLEVYAGALKAGYIYEGQLTSEYQLHLSKIALDKMLQIPGHAEFFGNMITIPYAAIKQGYAEGKHMGEIGWSGFLRDSMWNFMTLSMLPSPETVRVLGDMLSDDWKWPGYENEMLHGTMDTRALSSLSKLPIANPPTRKLHTDEDMREFLDDWKEWYAEIRSGQRALSFEGQPDEYRFKPDGTWETYPISNPHDERMKKPPASPPKQKGEEYGALQYLFGSIAALLALAGAWLGFRRMKLGV